MNEQIESFFVNTYVQKQYRERLLFELKNVSGKTPKRFYNAFKKFSHTAEIYIIPHLVAISSDKLTQDDVLSFVNKMVKEKFCYYMDSYGGDEITIYDAIEKAFNSYNASIIVYKDIFSIIKEETCIASPKKIILINQK